MKKKLTYFKSLLEGVFAARQARPSYRSEALNYLEKEDVVVLSNQEEEFIALESHRLLLRQRARKLRQKKMGLHERPEPGQVSYAVFSDR